MSTIRFIMVLVMSLLSFYLVVLAIQQTTNWVDIGYHAGLLFIVCGAFVFDLMAKEKK